MEVKFDGRKIQEVKDHYLELAEREIMLAKRDGTELSESDENVIRSKHIHKANDKIQMLLQCGPQRAFKLGFALDSHGWRTGYTKSPIEKRTAPRRAKKKMARKTKQKQRRK